MSSIIASTLNGVVQPITNALLTQVNALPQMYSYAGTSANFLSVSSLTGSFTSLLCATGTFGSVQSNGYYNSSGTQLSQTNSFYVGSVASTGASTTLLFNTVLNRNFTVGTTGASYVSSITIPSGSWCRASYSLPISTMPPSSKLTANFVFNGAALADSLSLESNLPQMTGLGAINAVASTTTLSGACHFVASTTAPLQLSLANTTGTCVIGGGSIECQILQ